jgi:hypothetical protein
MKRYVLPPFGDCVIITITFDLWMFKTRFDTFALLVNFNNKEWVHCQITIKLFEARNFFG